jgi:hypothetical protein
VEPVYFTVVTEVVVSLTGDAVSKGQGKLGSSDRRDWQAILPQSDGGWGVGLDIVAGWS